MLNPRMKKRPRYTVNREGYVVYTEDISRELFLLASNLKPGPKFYDSRPVQTFMTFVEELPKGEYKFALALARFLAKSGIKLAPILILNKLAEEVRFPDSYIDIFDRPDKIAHYVHVAKYRKPTRDDGFRNLSTWERIFLRKALEQLKPHTLKKMQLRKRQIKVKDLIKMLRPKPSTDELAKTYKEIIEGTAKIVTLLTKRSQDDEEATAYFEQNIDKMPVNMLIRNLRKYKDTANPTATKEKIMARLMGMPLTDKVVNPFDFVSVAIEVPSLEDEMTQLIKKFVADMEFKAEGRTAILYDISGSMQGRGHRDGFKNIVLLTHILDVENIHYFSNRLENSDLGLLKLIRQGRIREAWEKIRKPYNGTAVLRSLTELIATHPHYDNIVIISDEQTWADGYRVDAFREIAKMRNLICINPVKYKGTAFKDKLLALASIDAKLMFYLRMLLDWIRFKQTIIEEYGA